MRNFSEKKRRNHLPSSRPCSPFTMAETGDGQAVLEKDFPWNGGWPSSIEQQAARRGKKGAEMGQRSWAAMECLGGPMRWWLRGRERSRPRRTLAATRSSVPGLAAAHGSDGEEVRAGGSRGPRRRPRGTAARASRSVLGAAAGQDGGEEVRAGGGRRAQRRRRGRPVSGSAEGRRWARGGAGGHGRRSGARAYRRSRTRAGEEKGEEDLGNFLARIAPL